MSDDNVEIRVSLRNTLSESAKMVDESLDSIERHSGKADVTLKALEQTAKKTGRELAKLGVDSQGGALGIHEVGDEAEETAVKLEVLNRVSKETTREGSGSGGGGLFKLLNFGKMFSALKLPLKIGVIAQGIGLLANGVLALGTAGFAGVAGLAPLAGLLVAIPGFMGAFAQGMGVGKIATMGLGKAITDLLTPNMNPTQLALDLSHLSPAMRKVAYAVAGLRPQFKALAGQIQNQAAPVFLSFVKLLKTDYAGIFSKGLLKTGGALTSVGNAFHNFLAKSSTKAQIAQALGSNASVLKNLGLGGVSGFSAFLNIMQAAQPMIVGLSKSVQQFFDHMAWNSKKGQAGLTKFFNNSLKVGKETWSYFKNVGNGLWAMGRASLGLSHSMGQSFLDGAKKFNAWANGAAGQAKLKKFFAEMKPSIYAWGNLIKAVGKAFVTIGTKGNFVKTIEALQYKLLPALVNFITSMNSTGLIENLASLLGLIAKFATTSHIFQSMAKIMGGIAWAIGVLVNGFGHLPSWLRSTIGLAGAFLLLTLKLKVFRDMYKGLLGDFASWTNLLGGKLVSKILAKFGFEQGSLMASGMKLTTIVKNSFVNGIKMAMAKAIPLIKTALDALSTNSKSGASKAWGWLKSGVKAISSAGGYLIGKGTKLFGKGTGGGATDITTGTFAGDVGATGTGFAGGVAATGVGVFAGLAVIAEGVKMGIDNARITRENKGLGTPQWAGNPGVTGQTYMSVAGSKPVKKWTGGSVLAGNPYIVGEVGAEGFLSRSGKFSMIGVKGQELTSFAEDGTVIPNHQLKNKSFMSNLLKNGSAVSQSVKNNSGTSSTSISIGNIEVHQAQDFDVVNAVRRAIVIEQQNAKERR